MAGPRRSSPESWKGRLCTLGLLACGGWPPGPALAQNPPSGNGWQAALAARQSFEAEPREEHTPAEFAQVMDNFRAIYHTNPADLHAPRAVDQVAQLLAEQGRELHDPKSLRAAAGQYQFLAKAYPASSLAGPGLAQALDLLSPEGANDPAEAAKVRALLKEQYPHTPAIVAPRQTSAPVVPRSVGTVETPAPSGRSSPVEATDAAPYVSSGATVNSGHYVKRTSRVSGPAASLPPADATSPVSDGASAAANGHHPAALVTGIRHWSTASYTRVAIDLGGEVQFQAARVEHPDRIFFDLHGAKLAPGLAGKVFAVTDDGFLKTIRAAPSGAGVTRVVLDVQPVAEYSAFLLPNPYRLIIDIHGKAAPEVRDTQASATVPVRTYSEQPTSGPKPGSELTLLPSETAVLPPETSASLTRQPEGAAYSTLPPMPVTDGSASFGLPPRRTEPVASAEPVARPRVVISAKPTTAKPVPNSVTSTAADGSREVASVSDAPGVVEATPRPTSRPVVDRVGKATASASVLGKSKAVAIPAQPAPPTADGQKTLMRALGLKIGRIVIDAGHGGHDSGTLGADGIEEKDVVLDVALRLGKLLHDRLGAEVVYTRADDTFIPLETRTAIANKAQADLFISVHANSSDDPSARGVEVYYLNFTSDPEAMQVASRENAVSSQRVNQLSDLVKKIALKDKIDESRELAADVDQSLYGGLHKGNEGLRDRGVKKAPFVVLIGANMPSILAEISFVTNPDDADELSRPEYRERVAESLYGGVARYAGAINGAKTRPRATERAQR